MKKENNPGISFFQRYLTVWVFLCMVVGVLLGAEPCTAMTMGGADRLSGKPERNVVPMKGDTMGMARAGNRFPIPATRQYIFSVHTAVHFNTEMEAVSSETGSCRWTSVRSCSTGLWITQRSIRMAGWFSIFATEWK